MSTQAASRTRAGAPGQRDLVRSRAPAPQTPADRLRRLSDRFDILLRDVDVGARSQREHDRHVEEAEAIAAGIIAIFRRPTAEAAVHAPAWSNGRGKAFW